MFRVDGGQLRSLLTSKIPFAQIQLPIIARSRQIHFLNVFSKYKTSEILSNNGFAMKISAASMTDEMRPLNSLSFLTDAAHTQLNALHIQAVKLATLELANLECVEKRHFDSIYISFITSIQFFLLFSRQEKLSIK